MLINDPGFWRQRAEEARHLAADASDEIAAELAQACADRGETPPSIADFVVDHTRPSPVG